MHVVELLLTAAASNTVHQSRARYASDRIP